MKVCSYCGKRYPDDVVFCATDGQPLVDEIFKRSSIPPGDLTPSFDINLASPLSQSGKYRVFVEKNDLIFIPLEGKRSVLESLAHFLGPVGYVVQLAFWIFSKQKTAARLRQTRDNSPEELLRENDSAFKLYSAEIRRASIEPSSILAIGGKAGRLNLLVRHGEKLKFEFFDAAGIVTAIHWLGPFLGSNLEISSQWNEQKQEFEKRKRS